MRTLDANIFWDSTNIDVSNSIIENTHYADVDECFIPELNLFMCMENQSEEINGYAEESDDFTSSISNLYKYIMPLKSFCKRNKVISKSVTMMHKNLLKITTLA